MLRILTFTLLAFTYFGCAPKVYTLKGSYPAPPIIYHTDKSFEQVWSNVIDLFAQKGIPIQLVDKSSGLIISGPATLTWSFEDKTGKLFKKDAWVVLPKVIDRGNNKIIKPYAVYGSWNIRIKVDSGKTAINTNLYNISAGYGLVGSYPMNKTPGTTPIMDGKSTGEFEKLIFDLVR